MLNTGLVPAQFWALTDIKEGLMASGAPLPRYAPCFAGSIHEKFLLFRPLPKTLGMTAKGWGEYYSFSNIAIDERARPVFDLGRFPVSTGELHIPVVFRAKDILLRERDVAGVRSVASTQRFITPTVETALLLAAQMDQKELTDLGIKWLIVMHDRVYAKGLGRGFLALTPLDGKMTITFCLGKKKWAEGAAFLFLAQRQLAHRTEDLKTAAPTLLHADPVY